MTTKATAILTPDLRSGIYDCIAISATSKSWTWQQTKWTWQVFHLPPGPLIKMLNLEDHYKSSGLQT